MCDGVFLLSSVLIVKIPWDSCPRLFLHKIQCIIQTSWLWCTWSPHTRLLSKQVRQNVPWWFFLVAKSARFHPSGFIKRVSEEDNATCRQKNRTISLCSKWECRHTPSWLEWWRLDKKCAFLMPLEPWIQQTLPHDRRHAQHCLWQLRNADPQSRHVLQVVILHTLSSKLL